MNNLLSIPFYIRVSLFITGLYFLTCILIAGQSIIVPIIYATLFAILLNPVVNLLVRIGLNRALSIIITILIAVAFIALLLVLFSSEASRFGAWLPAMINKFSLLLDQSVDNFSGRFNVSATSINERIANGKSEVLNHLSATIGTTISSMGEKLILLLLMPLYVFMISFYKPLLIEFMRKIAGTTHRGHVNELLSSTKSLIQSYLVGLLIEAIVVATLYSTGLLLIGIQYAVLLGIIGALLNIIPYLGGLIAVSFYMIIAFITEDSTTAVLWVAVLYVVVHVIDNSFIIPKVVASKVKINALVAITVVLTGSAIWGVPGMFLAIPLTGVVKLVFDRIEALKPLGFLLGDTMPPIIAFKTKPSKKQDSN